MNNSAPSCKSAANKRIAAELHASAKREHLVSRPICRACLEDQTVQLCEATAVRIQASRLWILRVEEDLYGSADIRTDLRSVHRRH